MSQIDYRYEETIQNRIKDFLGQAIQGDYVEGKREINLNLTVMEAEYLFTANEKVKKMAASGELQKLHSHCDDLASQVDTAYIKTMDILNRTELQINQAENDIYEEIQETHEELSNLKLHGESLSEGDFYKVADNFQQIK